MERRYTKRLFPALGAVALVTGSFALFLAEPAAAVSFQVTTTNNAGAGSLRQAFADASATGGEIDVAAGLGTIF